MKKGIEKTLGILSFILIAVGIFFMVMRPFSPTGAVIDLSTSISRISFFVGLALFIIGIFLFIVKAASQYRETGRYGSKSERVFSVSGLEGIAEAIQRSNPDTSRIALILDASAAIKFGNKNPEKLAEFLKQYENAGAEIIIPNYVLNKEVRNRKTQSLLKKYAAPASKNFRVLAREYLKGTDKHQGALHLIPYLKNPELIKKADNREMGKIKEEMASLAHALNIEEKDIQNKKPQDIYEIMMRNGLAGKGDISVLSSALAKTKNKDAYIVGRDMHLREAVSDIKEDHKEFANKLRYIEFK